jgi:hypothetical protein
MQKHKSGILTVPENATFVLASSLWQQLSRRSGHSVAARVASAQSLSEEVVVREGGRREVAKAAGMMPEHSPVPPEACRGPRVDDQRRTVPTSRRGASSAFRFWHGNASTQN